MKKNSETISTLPFRVMTVSLATILNRISCWATRMLFGQCDRAIATKEALFCCCAAVVAWLLVDLLVAR